MSRVRLLVRRDEQTPADVPTCCGCAGVLFIDLLHGLQQLSVFVGVAQVEMETGELSTIADAQLAETRLCAAASAFHSL